MLRGLGRLGFENILQLLYLAVLRGLMLGQNGLHQPCDADIGAIMEP